MFYTGLPAYNFIPSESQYDELKEKKKRIALFMPADSIIPEYLKNDKQLILLHDTLKECE
jgi:4-amino-4-deoxy-L-arabinose transferase